MTFCVDDETGALSENGFSETFEKVVRCVLEQQGCPYEAEVSLTVTNQDEIRSLNAEFRNVDSVTDVLSFPMIDFPSPGDFSSIDEESADCFNPETGELMLGDIVICMDRVRSQAEEYGHSLQREFAYLTAHSMLHLLGYDHMDEESEKLMSEAAGECLDALGIFRE